MLGIILRARYAVGVSIRHLQTFFFATLCMNFLHSSTGGPRRQGRSIMGALLTANPMGLGEPGSDPLPPLSLSLSLSLSRMPRSARILS